MPSTIRQAYDHRVRDAIVESSDIGLFPQLRIPDSTRRSWLRRGSRTVVTASRLGLDHVELQNRIAKLERQALPFELSCDYLLPWSGPPGSAWPTFAFRLRWPSRELPARLTFEERITIRNLVESEQYRLLSLLPPGRGPPRQRHPRPRGQPAGPSPTTAYALMFLIAQGTEGNSPSCR